MTAIEQKGALDLVLRDDSAGVRRCSDCKLWLRRELFGADRSRRDRVNTKCRTCTNLRAKTYLREREREEAAVKDIGERCDLCAHEGRLRKGPFVLWDGLRACAKHLKRRARGKA